MINKILKVIKQLFCKHEWRSIGCMCRFTSTEEGYPAECMSDELECVKCGKHKIEFIRSPYCFD